MLKEEEEVSADGNRAPPQSFVDEMNTLGHNADSTVDELTSAIGFTHFDTSGSHDSHVTILITKEDIQLAGSQALLRVKSREDNRSYIGTIVKGPFSEPDAVPANSTMAVSVITQGKKIAYSFDYHGRAEVEIFGEEIDGAIVPARYRPRPKSPVFRLTEDESRSALGMTGDLCLGRVAGYENLEARFPSDNKNNLPRHLAIIGTTGGGKSTTVATLLDRTSNSGIATIVLDVEGEYTHADVPTSDISMKKLLTARGQEARGLPDLHLLCLTNRESSNPTHKNLRRFSLKFSNLSPYAVAEILDMSDAQQERFHAAFDIAQAVGSSMGFATVDPLKHDPFTEGVPGIRLDHVLDVVNAYNYVLSPSGKEQAKSKSKKRTTKRAAADLVGDENEDESSDDASPTFYTEFSREPYRIMQKVHSNPISHPISWRSLAGKLWRLKRLDVFDKTGQYLNFEDMLCPGRTTVIDLSDTDSPQLNNLVIAEILRGVQSAQEERYSAYATRGEKIPKTLLVIEEAHEFLSASRISKMPILFEQIARIAKRGRKRWLGLVFVTQLPQHLPGEILGLVNNFVLHKVSDASVITKLQKALGGVDDSLWQRLPRLAPGQAVVGFATFARPVLVNVDPAPCKRMLVE